ncbi:hypothetical protein AMECASPLE_020659, partial [Ameca splendens]
HQLWAWLSQRLEPVAQTDSGPLGSTKTPLTSGDKLGEKFTLVTLLTLDISICQITLAAPWTQVLGAVNQQLQKSQDILVLWEVYNQLKGSLSNSLQMLQSDFTFKLSSLTEQDNTVAQAAVMVTNMESILKRANTLLCDLGQVLEVSKDLTVYLEPLAAGLVQSESRLLSRSILQLSQQVSARRDHLQEELKWLQDFENDLESLETTLEDWQRRLESRAQTDQPYVSSLASWS